MGNPYELARNILLSETATPEDGRFTSVDLYGVSAQENRLTDNGDNCFHLENESGTGDITLYHVFPGIELVYNDMHMAYCNRHQRPAPHVMEINYCKEGRCECLFRGRHTAICPPGISPSVPCTTAHISLSFRPPTIMASL